MIDLIPLMLQEEHTDTSAQVTAYQSNGRIMRLTLLPVFVNRIFASFIITIYE